jgi:hypothetical protein
MNERAQTDACTEGVTADRRQLPPLVLAELAQLATRGREMEQGELARFLYYLWRAHAIRGRGAAIERDDGTR